MPKKYEVRVNDKTDQLVITSAGRPWFKSEARIVHEGDPALPELMTNELLDVVEIKPPTRRRRKAKVETEETNDEAN